MRKLILFNKLHDYIGVFVYIYMFCTAVYKQEDSASSRAVRSPCSLYAKAELLCDAGVHGLFLSISSVFCSDRLLSLPAYLLFLPNARHVSPLVLMARQSLPDFRPVQRHFAPTPREPVPSVFPLTALSEQSRKHASSSRSQLCPLPHFQPLANSCLSCPSLHHGCSLDQAHFQRRVFWTL
jgi:hypothetical protein